MGSPKAVRTVSQEAFDEMVKENMEDLGMHATEALEDAIQTLTLQGIVTCVLGVSSVNDNPVIQMIERLKQLDLELASSVVNDGVLKEIVELLDRLNDSCTGKGSGVWLVVLEKLQCMS
ncbi:PREDICTED: uncharacterized protein LOC109187189 isoform X2 [Ipomoea nil]|uniref:uncharacterized protein LOC109187189 isoform X2 n=1 Tax=Ipomoea nil TaxID=35883 RepID=UPI000901CD43|nr:PREDICTED: uncharacterized protein LOC109187189 isoform X2 [Ipomoea nil]